MLNAIARFSLFTLSNLEQRVYALFRLAFATVIFTHGLPKLLGSSHGSMANPMQGSINLIENVLGFPFAEQIAIAVMLLETFGAVLLALGLFTRFIALIFCFQMLGICYALGPTWPWIDRGIEYPFMLLVMALLMLSKGAGQYSLDNLIASRNASKTTQF